MLRRVLLGFGATLCLYFILAALGGLITGPFAKVTEDPKTTRVLLVSGPIHYDLLLPLNAQTTNRFSWLIEHGLPLEHPEAKWLIVGWGAREFYTATGGYSDLSSHAIWRGLTGDSAVLRVDLAGPLPSALDTRALDLSNAQYAALLGQIETSFAQGPHTAPLDETGFSNTDKFFAAKGRFHLFNTCNVWIGKTLRAAGLPFGIWTPTPYAVSLAHWKNNPRPLKP